MQVNDALNIGVQGFQQAQGSLNDAATRIAGQQVTDASSQSIDRNDLTTAVVDLKVAEHDAKANAKVIEAASNTLGTLLDIEV